MAPKRDGLQLKVCLDAGATLTVEKSDSCSLHKRGGIIRAKAMNGELLSLWNGLCTARDETEAFSMLAGYMFRSGFSRCMHAVALARSAEKDTPRIIHARANFDLGDGFRFAHRFFQDHADLRDCLQTLAPTRWEQMGKPQRQVPRAPRSAGLSSPEHGIGVMLPVLGLNNEIGIIGFAKAGTTKPQAAITRKKIARLYQISSCYHAATMRFIELPKDIDRRDLSRREVECLRWTALGKTSSEIAQILGISARTVVYHLRNAGGRLNAVNRTHAVARAIMTGMIAI